MAESNNLRGIAWDLFTADNFGRLEIQRLDLLRNELGEEAGLNDVFASDLAALEFVQQMALHGDEECVRALEMVRVSEDQQEEGWDG